MRFVLAILIVVVVLAGTGCESLRKTFPTFGNKYRVENFFVDRQGLMKVSRVVVLPFVNCSDYSDAPAEVADMLALELRKLRKFDVVVIDEGSGAPAISAYRNGSERMQEIRSVCRAYNANAVLVGEIKSYEPYRPFVLISQVFGFLQYLFSPRVRNGASEFRRFVFDHFHVAPFR